MSKQYVQHISGQGEKWEVKQEAGTDYEVIAKHPDTHCGIHWLPKSEYRPCEPPERWEDVTAECEVSNCFIKINGMPLYGPLMGQACGDGYRLRKTHLETVPQEDSGAYVIVERKVRS